MLEILLQGKAGIYGKCSGSNKAITAYSCVTNLIVNNNTIATKNYSNTYGSSNASNAHGGNLIPTWSFTSSVSGTAKIRNVVSYTTTGEKLSTVSSSLLNIQKTGYMFNVMDD